MKIFLLIVLFNLFFLPQSFLAKSQNLRQGDESFYQLRSSHFIINYQEGVDRAYARKIKEKSEHFYKKITQEFHLVRDKLWLWDNRAKIFIAKDKEEYLRNFYCPDWSAACVDYQTKTIYTYPSQKDFIAILAHELTHIIFREYIERGSLPLWLDEGMALYIEANFAGSEYHDFLYQIQERVKNNNFIPFEKIMNLKTFDLKDKTVSEVNIFYLQSFSMINFIVKRYHKHRFSQFLWNLKNESDVEKALSKTYYHLNNLSNFEEKWKEFYLK
ncbi:MAG: hypothetical protein K9L95_00045 [Candidatus Omnitrophica bacterium]|nr:hypothetical protein [Candidatus Omnitrophota bacterium]MCF7877029.1 hypothetical protein [Candidatus Omnitrophota bacterium]MCF7877851.1 hypothetical protein [Candidatus Omnitrophota bacterium]MCF7892543.1 hypothetical protein [Candidatus Omnitrophota bacterium]